MAKFLVGVVFAVILMAIIGGICELATLDSGEVGRLQTLMEGIQIVDSSSPVGIVETAWSYVSATADWLNNLFSMITWDYPFFQGSWDIVRYILFIPITIGVIWGALVLLRGGSA